MFSDIFQRFIQQRPVATMVLVLLENFLNAGKLDRWFNTVRPSQYRLFGILRNNKIKLK